MLIFRFSRFNPILCSLGGSELIETNHFDVVEANCIESEFFIRINVDPLINQASGLVNIHPFHDKVGICNTISQGSWYYRMTAHWRTSDTGRLTGVLKVRARTMESMWWMLTIYHQNLSRCGECAEIYGPDEHEQRFCPDCDVWYHIHCMDKIAKTPSSCRVSHENAQLAKAWVERGCPSSDVPLDALHEAIHVLPILRGNIKGVSESDYPLIDRWRITGTGEKREAWLNVWTCEEDALPHDWMKQLGRGFIRFTLGYSPLTRYSCPGCGSAI